MSIWERVWKLFGGQRAESASAAATRPPLVMDEEPEPEVPEVTVEALRLMLTDALPPLVIDIREPYEWRLVRVKGMPHIPMNEVPDALERLPREQAIVVMCAHGSRSYSVAAWLNEQGYKAMSLAGGITQWAREGGEVVQGEPSDD